jgi:osmotically-inducible protein OsmY
MHARRIVIALLLPAAFSTAAIAEQPTHVSMQTKTALHKESAIIVTEARPTDDAIINADVVEALASDSRLAGRIGVQTLDREVELSGIVTSPGQSMQAERDAKSVYGVRNVRNLLSTRIGGGRF